MRHHFNNKKPKKDPPFTDDMKRELKKIYHLYTLEELAEHFERTVNQVKNQAERQYLSKSGRRAK